MISKKHKKKIKTWTIINNVFFIPEKFNCIWSESHLFSHRWCFFVCYIFINRFRVISVSHEIIPYLVMLMTQSKQRCRPKREISWNKMLNKTLKCLAFSMIHMFHLLLYILNSNKKNLKKNAYAVFLFYHSEIIKSLDWIRKRKYVILNRKFIKFENIQFYLWYFVMFFFFYFYFWFSLNGDAQVHSHSI